MLCVYVCSNNKPKPYMYIVLTCFVYILLMYIYICMHISQHPTLYVHINTFILRLYKQVK